VRLPRRSGIPYVGEKVAWTIWAISGLALMATYALRFRKKANKQVIDYLKGCSIILIILYPIHFKAWMLITNNPRMVSSLLILIIPMIVGIVYTYDRFILKPREMKKKFVVILVAQTIAILMLLVFTLYQQTLTQNALIQVSSRSGRHRKMRVTWA
jgi:hypothetical protein